MPWYSVATRRRLRVPRHGVAAEWRRRVRVNLVRHPLQTLAVKLEFPGPRSYVNESHSRLDLSRTVRDRSSCELGWETSARPSRFAKHTVPVCAERVLCRALLVLVCAHLCAFLRTKIT